MLQRWAKLRLKEGLAGYIKDMRNDYKGCADKPLRIDISRSGLKIHSGKDLFEHVFLKYIQDTQHGHYVALRIGY